MPRKIASADSPRHAVPQQQGAKPLVPQVVGAPAAAPGPVLTPASVAAARTAAGHSRSVQPDGDASRRGIAKRAQATHSGEALGAQHETAVESTAASAGRRVVRAPPSADANEARQEPGPATARKLRRERQSERREVAIASDQSLAGNKHTGSPQAVSSVPPMRDAVPTAAATDTRKVASEQRVAAHASQASRCLQRALEEQAKEANINIQHEEGTMPATEDAAHQDTISGAQEEVGVEKPFEVSTNAGFEDNPPSNIADTSAREHGAKDCFDESYADAADALGNAGSREARTASEDVAEDDFHTPTSARADTSAQSPGRSPEFSTVKTFLQTLMERMQDQQVSDFQAICDRLEQVLQHNTATVEQLGRQLDLHKGELATFGETLASTDRKVNQAHENISALRKESTQARAHLDERCTVEEARTAKHIHNITARLDSCEGTVQHLDGDMHKVGARLTAVETTVRTLSKRTVKAGDGANSAARGGGNGDSPAAHSALSDGEDRVTVLARKLEAFQLQYATDESSHTATIASMRQKLSIDTTAITAIRQQLEESAKVQGSTTSNLEAQAVQLKELQQQASQTGTDDRSVAPRPEVWFGVVDQQLASLQAMVERLSFVAQRSSVGMPFSSRLGVEVPNFEQMLHAQADQLEAVAGRQGQQTREFAELKVRLEHRLTDIQTTMATGQEKLQTEHREDLAMTTKRIADVESSFSHRCTTLQASAEAECKALGSTMRFDMESIRRADQRVQDEVGQLRSQFAAATGSVAEQIQALQQEVREWQTQVQQALDATAQGGKECSETSTRLQNQIDSATQEAARHREQIPAQMTRTANKVIQDALADDILLDQTVAQKYVDDQMQEYTALVLAQVQERFLAPVERRFQSFDHRMDELMAKLLSIEEGSVSSPWAEPDQLEVANEGDGVDTIDTMSKQGETSSNRSIVDHKGISGFRKSSGVDQKRRTPSVADSMGSNTGAAATWADQMDESTELDQGVSQGIEVLGGRTMPLSGGASSTIRPRNRSRSPGLSLPHQDQPYDSRRYRIQRRVESQLCSHLSFRGGADVPEGAGAATGLGYEAYARRFRGRGRGHAVQGRGAAMQGQGQAISGPNRDSSARRGGHSGRDPYRAAFSARDNAPQMPDHRTGTSTPGTSTPLHGITDYNRPSFGRGREHRRSSEGGAADTAIGVSTSLLHPLHGSDPLGRRDETSNGFTVFGQPTLGSRIGCYELQAGEVLSPYFVIKYDAHGTGDEHCEDPKNKDIAPKSITDNDCWYGDKSRMAFVGEENAKDQGFFQVLDKLEHKFFIYNVIRVKNRIQWLFRVFEKVPSEAEHLRSFIDMAQQSARAAGGKLGWADIRKLLLREYTPPDWWPQTLDLWRGSQKQGPRPGGIWLTEYNLWSSVIQRILPDEPVVAPKFQGLLLRGGVSPKLDEELRRRHGQFAVTDAQSVTAAIMDVCTYQGGCAEAKPKKDKAEVKRVAAETAREAIVSDLGFQDQKEFADMLPALRGVVKAMRTEPTDWPRTEGAASARITDALRSERDLDAACKRLQYQGAMADMLLRKGVTREMFDQRFRDRLCVLCGQAGHRLYTCPQYSQQMLDEQKVQIQMETQQQMLQGREPYRSREQQLRTEAMNARTKAGVARNFQNQFRQDKSRELQATEPQVVLKLSQAQAAELLSGRATTTAVLPSASRKSAQRNRAAHSIPAGSQGSVSHSSDSDADSLDEQLITWQELGNEQQGSRRRD